MKTKQKHRLKVQYSNFIVLWSNDFAKKQFLWQTGTGMLMVFWAALKLTKYSMVFGGMAFTCLRLRDLLTAENISLVETAAAAVTLIIMIMLLGVVIVSENLDYMRDTYDDLSKEIEKCGFLNALAGNGAIWAKTDKKGRIKLHIKNEEGEVTFHKLKPGEVKVMYDAPATVYDMDKDLLVMPYIKEDDMDNDKNNGNDSNTKTDSAHIVGINTIRSKAKAIANN